MKVLNKKEMKKVNGGKCKIYEVLTMIYCGLVAFGEMTSRSPRSDKYSYGGTHI